MNTKEIETDLEIYMHELKGFLPTRIFDAHVHLFDASCRLPGAVFPDKSYYQKLGGVITLEQYLTWSDAHLPDQELFLNSFGHPSKKSDLDASAVYSGRISDNERFFGMAMVSPEDPVEAVRQRVVGNRLIGYKPYLLFVSGKPAKEVEIFEMLTPEQMELADALGLAITLHIPRDGRLADPLNQTQMVELCRRYPNTSIIFAHIGRAYYLRSVVGFLDGIAACPNAYIDTSMVNHERVLEYAFNHFPRERILFGSDAPIAFLRGKSVEINNQYAYLMGEDYAIGTSIFDDRHVVDFTSFYYEQLCGIKRAAERVGLSAAELENIFFNNAYQLFRSVVIRNYGTC